VNANAESVEHFLKAAAYEPESRRSDEIRPFVTISRQAGAGGHSLSDELAKQMKAIKHVPLFEGWQVFDQEIIKMVTSNPKLRVYAPFWRDREYHSELEDMLSRIFANTSPQSEVIQEMFEIIRTLARIGKVILVGRGGACLTRGYPGGVHVRLVASPSVRIRRMRRLLEIDDPQAAGLVKDQDRARKALVRSHFGQDIDDPLLYDAVWNTEHTPLAVIASTLLRLIQYKTRQQAPVAASAAE
jgi:cytidylate kinase